MEPGGQQGELAHHHSEISDPQKEPDVTFIVPAGGSKVSTFHHPAMAQPM